MGTGEQRDREKRTRKHTAEENETGKKRRSTSCMDEKRHDWSDGLATLSREAKHTHNTVWNE